MSTCRATLLVAGLMLGCAVPAAPAAPADAGPAQQDRVEREIVRQVNAIRAEHGLRPLRPHRGLARAADAKAREIAATAVLSHTSPDGTSMDRRIRRYVRAERVGETLGFVPVRSRQARRMVDRWMASPVHRAALLDPVFRRVGVGRRKGHRSSGRVAAFALDLASSR